jgi:adenosylcobinamide-phosphate synthase
MAAAGLSWPTQGLALVAGACLLDRLLGDPQAWLHPVQVMGWIIGRLRRPAEAWAGDQPARLRLMGLMITLVLVLGSALAGWSLERLAGHWPLVGVPLLLIGMASALAGRSLEQAVKRVLGALPDLGEARSRLAWIVGRQVQDLDGDEILRAAAETASENAVDGLFAPLFWMIVGATLVGWPRATATVWPGPLALAWAFKAASTLDSMLGYKIGRLRWLGTAGARLDDVLTWVPARLVALTLPLAAGRPDRILRWFAAALREGAADPSPNAGVSQAAFAMAARVRLGGINRYADGAKAKPLLAAFAAAPNPASVERILRLTVRLEVLWLVLAPIVLAAIGHALQWPAPLG